MRLFEVCVLLGVAHPDQLGRMLTSRQIAEWEAYLSIEPRGERRADLRMARLCSTFANSQGADAEEDDFAFRFQSHEPLDPEELNRRIKSRFAAMGCRGLSRRHVNSAER